MAKTKTPEPLNDSNREKYTEESLDFGDAAWESGDDMRALDEYGNHLRLRWRTEEKTPARVFTRYAALLHRYRPDVLETEPDLVDLCFDLARKVSDPEDLDEKLEVRGLRLYVGGDSSEDPREFLEAFAAERKRIGETAVRPTLVPVEIAA